MTEEESYAIYLQSLGIGGGGAITLPSISVKEYGSPNSIEGSDIKGVTFTQRQFEITLSTAANTPQSVYYYIKPSTNDISADKNDFTAKVSFFGDPTYSKVDFAAGETSKIINIDISRDTWYEPKEYFTFVLIDPSSGIQLDPTNSSVTSYISNDDITATISAITPVLKEGDRGVKQCLFGVTLNQLSDVDQEVDWKIVGTGTYPTDNNDFTKTSGTVTIKKGTMDVILSVGVKGDTTAESNETFDVILSSNKKTPMAFSDEGKKASGTIDSEEKPSLVTMTVKEGYLYESEVVEVTFKLDKPQNTNETISWRIKGYENQEYFIYPVTQDDFLNNRFPNEAIGITAGKTEVKSSFTIKKDVLFEVYEGLQIELYGATSGLIYDNLINKTIRYIEPIPDNSVWVQSSTDLYFVEGSAGFTKALFGMVGPILKETVTFNWLLSGSLLPNGVDKNDFVGDKLPSGSFTIPIGDNFGYASFLIKTDRVAEFEESFSILIWTSDRAVYNFSNSNEKTKEWNINGIIGNDDGIVGTFNDENLKGTSKKDFINGRAGKDTINGGVDNDTLIGGENGDTFVFDSTLGSKNVDAIYDFTPRSVDIYDPDKIALKNSIFKAIGGNLTDDELYIVSSNPQDQNDFLIYDQITGKLYYDADANGNNPWIQFALIGTIPHPIITAADFTII